MEIALAEFVNAMWPRDTRPHIEREFDLTHDDARRIMEGRASKRLIQLVLQHPNGEFAVGLYLLARVIGRELDSAIEEDLAEDRREAERARQEEEQRERRLRRLAGLVCEGSRPAA